MSTLRDLRLARWKQIEQGGICRCVIMRGVLGFGLPMGLLLVGIGVVAGHTGNFPWFVWVPVMLAGCLAAGAVYGIGMWFLMLFLYARTLKSDR